MIPIFGRFKILFLAAFQLKWLANTCNVWPHALTCWNKETTSTCPHGCKMGESRIEWFQSWWKFPKVGLPLNHPCFPTRWGSLVCLDLNSKSQAQEAVECVWTPMTWMIWGYPHDLQLWPSVIIGKYEIIYTLYKCDYKILFQHL